MSARPVGLALFLFLTAAFACAGSKVRAQEPHADAVAAAPASGPERPAKAPRQNSRRPRETAANEAERGRPRVAPRMLDAIRIEGEIPVPQVLFITARDQRRFMEFQHHRYQVTSLELGRATPAPARLVLSTRSPDKATQEVSR